MQRVGRILDCSNGVEAVVAGIEDFRMPQHLKKSKRHRNQPVRFTRRLTRKLQRHILLSANAPHADDSSVAAEILAEPWYGHRRQQANRSKNGYSDPAKLLHQANGARTLAAGTGQITRTNPQS